MFWKSPAHRFSCFLGPSVFSQPSWSGFTFQKQGSHHNASGQIWSFYLDTSNSVQEPSGHFRSLFILNLFLVYWFRPFKIRERGEYLGPQLEWVFYSLDHSSRGTSYVYSHSPEPQTSGSSFPTPPTTQMASMNTRAVALPPPEELYIIISIQKRHWHACTWRKSDHRQHLQQLGKRDLLKHWPHLQVLEEEMGRRQY